MTEVVLEAHKNDSKPTSSGRMNMTQKNDNPKINENKTKYFVNKMMI